MWPRLKEDLERYFRFRLNQNQWQDLQRLLFEIHLREHIPLGDITAELKGAEAIHKASGRNKFFCIKDLLIKRRYPQTSRHELIDTKRVYLPQLPREVLTNTHPQKEFKPQRIFVEKEVTKSYLLERFHNAFPDVEIEELPRARDYLKNNKFSLNDLKKPYVFIVKEKWDFIKPCPCTKHHLGCGYWIFNLGFGCPFDCSYCFLQCYANFPGITLPANLDDFFERFDDFYKKLNRPIRIGTGEFCDSLALDEITGYAPQLIDFFRTKNLLFELKTKSNKIKNILNTSCAENIVISWSLNPEAIIEQEELTTASLTERLEAAKKVHDKGFSVAFHFDPVICYQGWENDYQQLIETIYRKLPGPFKWFSIGTLRAARELKPVLEKRFPESRIFYGELFLGEDKKLRYPHSLRTKIYKNMLQWIRAHDEQTPVYLCMENKETWKIVGEHFTSERVIENYLLGQ